METKTSNENGTEALNKAHIKSLPSDAEIEKKLFYPTDKEKDEAAIVGAKWLRNFIISGNPHGDGQGNDFIADVMLSLFFFKGGGCLD